jgi:hypothetical protein
MTKLIVAFRNFANAPKKLVFHMVLRKSSETNRCVLTHSVYMCFSFVSLLVYTAVKWFVFIIEINVFCVS